MSLTSGTPYGPTRRAMKDRLFKWFCILVSFVSVLMLVILLTTLISQGVKHLDLEFLQDTPSREPERAGLSSAIWGSVWVCIVCGLTALPIGVATAIFLEEYKPGHPLLQRLHGFLQLNISNLAGVPSIVYGIIGLTVFVQMFGMFGSANDADHTVGQRWYDNYYDEAGRGLFVKVDGKQAALVPAREDLDFRDQDGNEVEVLIQSEEQVAPIRASLQADLERFEDAIRDQVTDECEYTREEITTIVDAAFDGASLQLDRAGVEPTIIDQLFALNGVEGRDHRRGMREVITAIEQRESNVRLENVLAAGAMPTRVDQRSFYFLQLPFGRGVLAGGLTLMLVILPIVIVSSQEALRAVPGSLREGALAAGATKWQMVWKMTLPASVPGIMTGAILAMSRAIGEAAPILVIAGIVYITFTPHHLMDEFTVMPLQIYDWAGRPQDEFHRVAATGILVLLAVLLSFNATAVFLRQKFQKPLQ